MFEMVYIDVLETLARNCVRVRVPFGVQIIRSVEQLEARMSVKHLPFGIGGSSPSTPTNSPLAQLVEQ